MYMYVYVGIKYVYTRICMYMQVCPITKAQAGECNDGLTDDGGSPHVLLLACTCTGYLHADTCRYMQIHADTYIYIHIHAD